jgi:hypothetical protein
MTILRTATGKEYRCDFMGVAEILVTLFVRVQIDLVEALTVFQNPEETVKLEWIGNNGEVIRTEEGFTKFVGLSVVKGDCPVRIQLEQPD